MNYTVAVEKDVRYTTSFVDYKEGDGPFTARPLHLDVYHPEGITEPNGALIMAFGGAFHRGTKEDDRRPEEEPVNTNTAEYCRRFAALGYTCFSIDYRLTQADSHPGFTPTMGPEPVPTSRIDVVRKILGLPPATSDMLKRAQEGAIDDLVSAYRFVAGEAERFGIDPRRIAIGGFSAGGRMAVTAAFAEAISPCAVVALSGVAAASVIDAFHASGRRQMPIFMAYGEHDLDYVVPGAETMSARLQAANHAHVCHMLPGQTHFYQAECRLADGTTSLEQAMTQFLSERL